MKYISVPETLDEYRQYFKNQGREIKEVKVSGGYPYNSKTIGWELMENKNRVLCSAGYLIEAYKHLWAKENL